jgi:hypothetical protein
MDWMNYLIQLFDNEWYERYTGRNAREMRVPNPLLTSNQLTERTPRERTETISTFNPRDLNDTGMLSLQFMNDNKWFKSSDYLSVVGSTSLEDIFKQYGIIKKKEFLPLNEALLFVHSLNIKTNKEWDEYCMSGNKPENIPSNYRLVYNITTGEWLGTGRISDWEKEFISVDEFRTFCNEKEIDGRKKWNEYWSNNSRPNNIPSNPIAIYKFKNWPELLELNKRVSNTETWDFKTARKFVHKLKLKGNAGWREYSKSGNRPPQLPGNPYKIYKKQGTWTNWKDFLGDKTMRNPNKKN